MADSSNIELDNRRVLIVDDTHAIVQDFYKILSSQSANELADMEAQLFGQKLTDSKHQSIEFELDCAYQGKEALEKVTQAMADKKPYALAFVDVRMPPGWDGIQTIEHLWQVDPDLQIVICTAYSDYTWQETFDRLGNSDNLLILKKPFEDIEVLQMANAMVQKWNSTAQAQWKMNQLEALVQQRTERIAAQNRQLEDKIDELNQTRAQLIQSEKLAAIGQLAAGIAHEINNPMGFVHSNLDVLAGYADAIAQISTACEQLQQTSSQGKDTTFERENLSRLKRELDFAYILEDLPQLIQEALGGAARVKEIVADLKDYSHMKQVEMAPENLNQLIEQAINISKNETKYHVNIIKDLVALPLVPCWRNKLTQVILNLLVNASQSIEHDGQITIRTRADKKRVNIAVEDNGCGIAPEHLDKIFDPFFTTKEIGTGTGLGLHISHSIIESHGGTLSVESTLGRGSIFIITLPINNPLFDGITQNNQGALSPSSESLG